MKNILLVYPEMPDTFWAMRHFNQAAGKKSTYPPLGLMTVSALLPDQCEKKLVDLNVDSLKDADIDWADFVFLSAMNVQVESVNAIVQRCKKRNAKIVAGGPLFTHEYERFPDIDYFILNEAEITLPLFLKDLERGEAYVHRIYRTSDFSDMTETPLPDYSLINVNDYLYAIVQYSRGCPYLCDFCDVTALFGRKPRVKSPQMVIAELETILAQSTNTIVLFADDNLIGNKRHLKLELLPALIDWRRKNQHALFFATQLTINLADDDELMQLLLEAGFRHIFIGIETPEAEGLLATKKKQNLKRSILENIKKLHGAGFIISGGFIVGLDSDTPDIFDIQEQFIQESGIPLPIVNILKAPPGTELFDRIEKEGRLLKDFTFSEGDTNVRIKMGDQALYAGFYKLVSNLYTPEAAYRRILQFFKDYHPPKLEQPIPAKPTVAMLLQALMIILKVGYWYRERRYFWKLIFWTMLNKPKLMDQAIFYAVMIRQMHQSYRNMQPHLLEKMAQADALPVVDQIRRKISLEGQEFRG